MSHLDDIFGVRCFPNPAPSGPIYPVYGKENPRSEAALDQHVFEELCPVCGDKVSGYHYGLLTCESCKGFFKRTVQNKKVYSCVENKKCLIDKSQRKRCPFCRYQKCLKVGMRLDAVRSDRMRGGRNKFGPMYKQDRARKQQLQAFHCATGFLRVIDPGGALHSALEKSLFGSVRDWIQEDKTEMKPTGPHILFGDNNIETTNLWPYTAPQILLPSFGSAAKSNHFLPETLSCPPADCYSGRFLSNVDTKHPMLVNKHWAEMRTKKDSLLEDLHKTSFRGGINATDAQKQEAYHDLAGSAETQIVKHHHEPFRGLQKSNVDSMTRSHDFRLPYCIPTHLIHKEITNSTLHHSIYPADNCQSTFPSSTASVSPNVREHHLQSAHYFSLDDCHRSCNATLEALLKCEIDEQEVRTRSLENVKTTPDHGIAFICDVTNQALFLLVEWAKSSECFQALKTSDQMILLQNGWMDILVLDHAFRQVKCSSDSIVLPTGHCFPSNFYDKLTEQSFLPPKQDTNAAKNILHKFWELTSKLKNLHLDHVEYVCLKFIILFNTDASVESKLQLKKTQEQINSALWDYSLKHELPNRERVSQIFCTLCDIRAISMLCEEYLLHQYQNGNTPSNNLLMEMFNAKRNVVVR